MANQGFNVRLLTVVLILTIHGSVILALRMPEGHPQRIETPQITAVFIDDPKPSLPIPPPPLISEPQMVEVEVPPPRVTIEEPDGVRTDVEMPVALRSISSVAQVTSAPDETRDSEIVPPREDAARPFLPLDKIVPAASGAAHEQGTVVLTLFVHVDGRAIRAKVERSSGSVALDQAALRYAFSWFLRPGTRHGVPASMWVSATVHFGAGKADVRIEPRSA